MTWIVHVPAAHPWLTANKRPASRAMAMAEARLVKAWRTAAFYASTSAGTPIGLERARVDCRFVFVGRKPVREIENLRPTLKACVDGAIGPARKNAPGRGVLVDDDDTRLIYGSYAYIVFARSTAVDLRARVELTITDLSGAAS